MSEEKKDAADEKVVEKVEEKIELPPPIDLSDPDLYFNRELSWFEFNKRVLGEALDESWPLLERLKFLCIFSTNLDEFFMIRVAGIKQQMAAGVYEKSSDGYTPHQQLEILSEQIPTVVDQQMKCFTDDIIPRLEQENIAIHKYNSLTNDQKSTWRNISGRMCFPF